MGSSPNFRGASALLRGSSRAFSPKRASRDAPSVCLTGEGSVTPPRRPLPFGLGAAFFQSQSFTRFFPKNRGFQRQSLWSLIAMSEILYPVKRVFRVNCREAARGGFLQVKKPPASNCFDHDKTTAYRCERQIGTRFFCILRKCAFQAFSQSMQR